MNWREKRREELERLSSCDPALLAVRYEETALQSDAIRPPPGKVSLGTMIEAILDAEEAFHHPPRTPVRLPPRSDNAAYGPSHQESLKH